MHVGDAKQNNFLKFQQNNSSLFRVSITCATSVFSCSIFCIRHSTAYIIPDRRVEIPRAPRARVHTYIPLNTSDNRLVARINLRCGSLFPQFVNYLAQLPDRYCEFDRNLAMGFDGPRSSELDTISRTTYIHTYV